MISNRNFKGGAEVVTRINNEVSRLISRKNEILSILSYDIFEGIKAYEEFTDTTVKWFEEEQKLFDKNKQLIEQALRASEDDNKFYEAMEDIYHLESELNRAMNKHSELLNACMVMQKKADEMVEQAKFNRLRSTFDFRKVIKDMIEKDDTKNLDLLIKPLLKLNVKKTFSLSLLDNMLNIRTEDSENGEKVREHTYNEDFKYDDEIEDERIFKNHRIFIIILFDLLICKGTFDLKEYNQELIKHCGSESLKNGDYCSFLVHLCQKSSYDMAKISEKPDTFLEGYMQKIVMPDNVESTEHIGNVNVSKYKYLSFELRFPEEREELEIMGNKIVNIEFRAVFNAEK